MSSSRSRMARNSRGSRRAAATSCGRGILALVKHPTSPVGCSLESVQGCEQQAPANGRSPATMPALCSTALSPCQTRVALIYRQTRRLQIRPTGANQRHDERSEQRGLFVHNGEIGTLRGQASYQLWSIFTYVTHGGGNRTYFETRTVVR